MAEQRKLRRKVRQICNLSQLKHFSPNGCKRSVKNAKVSALMKNRPMNRALLIHATIWRAALLSLVGCSIPPIEITTTEEGSSSTGSSTASSMVEDSGPSTESSLDVTSSTAADSGQPSPDDTSTTDTGEETSTGNMVSIPSPIAMWTFNGNAYDQIGELDGIVNGALDFEVMDESEGLRFDATGYLDLSAANVVYRDLLGAGTVTMRLRADTWDTPRNTLLALGVPSPDPMNNVFILRIDDAQAELYIETRDSVEEFFQLGDSPSAQQWHRLTFVMDGAIVSYYVDGVERGSSVVPESDTMSEILNFGIWSGGNYFYGLLDDLTLYGEALTEEQVAAL